MGRMDSPPCCPLVASSRLGVRLRPFQADHLATPAAGQHKLTNDVHDRVYLACLAASRSIRPSIRYSASDSRRSAPLSFGLRMPGPVAFDNTRFDGVGKDATKKTDGARAVPAPPRTIAFTQLLGLDETRVFPAMMS